MHRRLWPRLAKLLLAVGAPLLAWEAPANVVGGDMQNFNAVPGGIDFVTVHSSETLATGYFNVSLMLNHAVNSLPYFEDDAGQRHLHPSDALTMLDAGLGFGIWDNLEIGLAGQNLLRQAVDDGPAHGEFTSTGFINYRVYGKARLFGDDTGGVAVVGSGVFNRVRSNPYIGRGGSPVTVIELAGDTTLRHIALAVNLGYRYRRRGDPIPGFTIQPIGNQYIGSVGVSYLLPVVDTKLIVEVFGSRPADRGTRGLSARQASSAEILAGLKHDLTNAVAVHGGAGTELLHGVSAPDWRLYAGINWAFGPTFERPKNDRVLTRVAPKEERAILRSINFATGSDRVPPEAVAELKKVAAEINAAPFTKIYVEGHTDSVGKAEGNLELSRRRAETVRRWLIDNAKIAEGKIAAVGFGETKPLADNGNFQGRALNRRVELRVLR